ncbi:MAG: hypothetical protein ACPH9F_08095 [Candidatus Poseidoniaceae archaeon]
MENLGEVGVTTTPNAGLANLLCHIRNPQNMLNYMILSAWLKFMGVAQHLPTVSIG